MPESRYVTFVLTAEVERALVQVLHELEAERGQRATWDEAFRRFLEMAGQERIHNNS